MGGSGDLPQFALGRRRVVKGIAMSALVFAAAATATFATTRWARRVWNRIPPDPAATAAPAPSPGSVPYASGRHLVAYIFVSSGCGFSSHPTTVGAVARIRRTLLERHSGRYAAISVVGVVIDSDLRDAFRYLDGVGDVSRAFDALSLGGEWLNDEIVRRVWRTEAITPSLPQVLLVERAVDATEYPARILVSADSTVWQVVGRDALIEWVETGTPIGPADQGG